VLLGAAELQARVVIKVEEYARDLFSAYSLERRGKRSSASHVKSGDR
jgi:hypothetical protein